MGMMPGMGKLSKQLDDTNFDDLIVRQQIALIQSMTRRERLMPTILQASRKKRIAQGSGLEVSELNKLLKMQRQMSDMMKKMGKQGGRGMLKGFMDQISGKGKLDSNSLADPSLIQKQFGSSLPKNLSGLKFKK